MTPLFSFTFVVKYIFMHICISFPEANMVISSQVLHQYISFLHNIVIKQHCVTLSFIFWHVATCIRPAWTLHLSLKLKYGVIHACFRQDSSMHGKDK